MAKNKATNTATNTATNADDGFNDFEGNEVAAALNVETFVSAEDLKEGAVVRGTLEGARLLPDEDRGGYRVVYALTLTRPLGANEVGAVVGLGERHQLKSLRNVTIGSEVAVRADGKVKLKKGGKTMHQFSVKVRPNSVSGAKTVAEVLNETWKASGAKDEWNAPAADDVAF